MKYDDSRKFLNWLDELGLEETYEVIFHGSVYEIRQYIRNSFVIDRNERSMINKRKVNEE